MFCGKCGKKLPDNAKFCNECGYKLPERKPVVPIVEQEIFTPDETVPEIPVYEPTPEPEYNYEPEPEYNYEPETEYIYEPEPAYEQYSQPGQTAKPVKQKKQKKQKQQKPKKKGKAGVVIAIILILALAAGAVWFFLFGGKDVIGRLLGKNQIEISDEVLEEIIDMEGLDEFDHPIEIYYAKVTDSEKDDDYREDYITVKGKNKYVTFEAAYIVSYIEDDGEWEFDDINKDFDHHYVGHAFITPLENITKDTVKEFVCAFLKNDKLRFDDISIEKFDSDNQQTAVELTVTGDIGGEYVTADLEAEFGITPDGWYIQDIEVTDKREAEEPEETSTPESDRPIPLETENNETEIAETTVIETEAPETEAPETEVPETEAPETEEPETEAPETKAPETEAPQTTPPETEPVQTTPPETEPPVVSDPKATLRVPAGYEVHVFTHDEATGKTIIIAKNTSDKMFYILDTNGNRLIDKGYDSYSKIESPYFGLKGKIYKYNFSKNTMDDVVREVYERLESDKPTDIFYNKEMDLLVKENPDWNDDWDRFTILDSRYNKQYYEMQMVLFDTFPRAGSYEQRQALKDAGNPYNMVGHTPIVVKKCSFSSAQMRLTDRLEVQMVINNFSTTNKYGVFGANVPFDYDELYAYAPVWEPLWYVANVGSDWGVIDNNNMQILKFKYGDIMVFANPEDGVQKLYAVVSKVVNGRKAWGVVDQYGNTIVPFEYEQIVPINFTTELKQVGCLGVAKTGYTNENLEFYVKKNGNWSAISAR